MGKNFDLELSSDFVLQLDAFELLDTILGKDDIVVEDSYSLNCSNQWLGQHAHRVSLVEIYEKNQTKIQ
jgi:hypothetical protein